MALDRTVENCLPFVTKVVLGKDLAEFTAYLKENNGSLPNPHHVDGIPAIVLLDPVEGNYCDNKNCEYRRIHRTLRQINAPETDIVYCDRPSVVEQAYFHRNGRIK